MQPGQGQKAYAGYATVEALVRKAQRRVNKVKYSPHPMPSFLSQDPSSSGNKATAPHPQPPTNSNQTGGPSTGETSWISKLVLPRLHIDAEKQNDSRQTQGLKHLIVL